MTIWALVQEWDLESKPTEKTSIKSKLAVCLNNLLLNDFAALVQVLYRVDVPEAAVKKALQQNPSADAGELLANLLLARVEEKKKTLQTFRTPPGSDDERW